MKETPLLMRGPLVLATLGDFKTQTRRLSGLEELNRYPGSLSGPGAACDLGYKGLCPSAYYIKDKAAYRKNPGAFHYFVGESDQAINIIPLKCPYGGAGDRLWVRENFSIRKYGHVGDAELTFAGGGTDEYRHIGKDDEEKWLRSRRVNSIHMPRWASRLTLEIVSVRVERVQDISHADAVAEGVAQDDAVHDFSQLWDSINAAPKPVKGEDGEISHYESYPWEDTRETRTYRGKPWLVIGNPWVWCVKFKRLESEVAR